MVFDDTVFARCVRVVPTRRIGDDTSIRFELLGCGRIFIHVLIVLYYAALQFNWNN